MTKSDWRFLALSGLLVSGTLLVLEPNMSRYAGASGIACGWLLLAALGNAGLPDSEARIPKWSALLLCLAILAKICSEYLLGSHLLPYQQMAFHPMHLAHAVGALAALTYHFSRTIPTMPPSIDSPQSEAF